MRCLCVHIMVVFAVSFMSLLSVGAQEVLEPKPSGSHTVDTLMLDSVISVVVDSVRKDSAMAILDTVPDRYRSWKPDPIRAMWLSMVFPGGGQIYNRKFWKLPLIYGGIAGCVYAITWNGQMMRDYSQAWQDITDDDPNTKSYEEMLPLNYPISGRETQLADMIKHHLMNILLFHRINQYTFLRAFYSYQSETSYMF